jgi:small redox-active disulfide protein 2
MMKIEILGTGCPKCKMLEANARKAVETMKIRAEIVKVTEIDKIIEYGVMSTPALVIDGKVKCHGRIADVEEIKKFIRQGSAE